MRKLFAIIMAMMLLSVSFASASLIGSGGTAPLPVKQTTTTPATTTTTPTATTTPGAPALPQAPQPNAFLWRGPGTKYEIYDNKDDKPTEQGYSFAGSYVLTQENLQLVGANQNKELASIANNKVAFKEQGNALDISVGATTINGWTGPDKFSFDTNPNTKYPLLFDGKPVQSYGSYEAGRTAEQRMEYHFVENGQVTDSYVRPLPLGGMIRSDASEKTVTITDSKGRPINTFSQDEWSKWSDNFKAVGDANYVAASYAIKDLGLSPEDVTLKEGKWEIEGGTISMVGGTVTVAKGTAEKGTTTETFVVENGKKSITEYITTDAKGITSSFVYGANEWKTETMDNGVLVPHSYPVQKFGEKSYVVLDTVMSGDNTISVVKDPHTGKTLYFDATSGKPATDAQMEKVDKTALNAAEAKGGPVEEAISTKNTNELPREQREVGLFDFVQYFQQYSGMSGWSSLIFDSKFLEKWKTSVNEFFCKTIVLGGIDCWASKICGQYTDITPTRDGVIFSTPVGGSPNAVAHIEAQRSLPIVNPEQTIWVYTVTFGLTNPNDEAISYNVMFGGEQTASWWNEAQMLGKGGTASAVGASALIKASRYNYAQVCLTFSPPIKAFDGKGMSKTCNDITQYSGGATAPYSAVTANETAAAQASAQPAGGSTPGGNI